MRYLHTMVRVTDLEASLDFYCNKLGMVQTRRVDHDRGRFTLVFLSAPDDVSSTEDTKSPLLELTYNWPDETGKKETYSGGRNFGHLAFQVEDIYKTCKALIANNITINRPPRDGYMAFIKSPDGISIELLQKGDKLPPKEPWITMENSGSW